MLEGEQLTQQQEKLKNVPLDEWEEAIDALTSELTRLLGGFIVGGKHGEKLLKGGKTVFGAHSEAVLGENALFFYEREFIFRIYDGIWEWPEGRSLGEQFVEMARSLTRNESKKYGRKKTKEERKKLKEDAEAAKVEAEYGCHIIEFVSDKNEVTMDVENMSTKGLPKDDDDGGEEYQIVDVEDYLHQLWELLCEAAEGDRELENYVQVAGETSTLKEQKACLKKGFRETENMKKRLKTRVHNKLQ